MSITLFDLKKRLSIRGCTDGIVEKIGDSFLKGDFPKAESADGGRGGIIK